jgi:solute carrier family 8 (sodium/calcium exchanger)
VLYLIGLLYSFLGIAIAADVFMCAIERITSSKRRVPIALIKGDAPSGGCVYTLCR